VRKSCGRLRRFASIYLRRTTHYRWVQVKYNNGFAYYGHSIYMGNLLHELAQSAAGAKQ
jgi:hypothetical protein